MRFLAFASLLVPSVVLADESEAAPEIPSPPPAVTSTSDEIAPTNPNFVSYPREEGDVPVTLGDGGWLSVGGGFGSGGAFAASGSLVWSHGPHALSLRGRTARERETCGSVSNVYDRQDDLGIAYGRGSANDYAIATAFLGAGGARGVRRGRVLSREEVDPFLDLGGGCNGPYTLYRHERIEFSEPAVLAGVEVLGMPSWAGVGLSLQVVATRVDVTGSATLFFAVGGLPKY